MLRSLLAVCLVLAAAGMGGCSRPAAPQGTPMVTAVSARPWNTSHSTGQELTTSHYRIYTTASNRVLRQYLPGFMEAAHSNYLELTALADRLPAEPMTIYMMSDRREWLDLSQWVFGPRGGAYASLEAGGYCYRGVGVFWDIGNLGTFAVAAHEGLHQFFYHRLRDRLPLWLEEGLCVTAEGYDIDGDSVRFTHERNTIRFNDLRTAIVQDHWVPLRRLLTMHSSEALAGGTERAVGYYGQLWALVRLIRSDPRYRAGLERLLTDAEAGTLSRALNVSRQTLARMRRNTQAYNGHVSEPLFRYYIAEDVAGFEEEYFAFAKRLVGLE